MKDLNYENLLLDHMCHFGSNLIQTSRIHDTKSDQIDPSVTAVLTAVIFSYRQVM